MFRIMAIAATLVLALPSLAIAQQPQGHPGAKAVRPGGGGPPPGGRAVVRPGPGVGGPHVGGPHVGGPPAGGRRVVGGPVGAQFTYHGHGFNRVHGAPFVYPAGWGYRRWAVGAILPPLFLVPAYYYADWAALGLTAPEPGFQWVRYGPDLVLVNVSTGEIVDVVYGAFY
jgi:Nickel/cobalt transporter regulator